MIHGTTILAIRHGGKVVVVGDGQVSLGQTVMKHSARKVRKLHHDRVIAGFAGATADAFTLFEKFEAKLEQFNGNLKRAAVELAKDWRTDRILRRLEALLIIADTEDLLVISGSGDVVEPDDSLRRNRDWSTGVMDLKSNPPILLYSNTPFRSPPSARRCVRAGYRLHFPRNLLRVIVSL